MFRIVTVIVLPSLVAVTVAVCRNITSYNVVHKKRASQYIYIYMPANLLDRTRFF